MAIFNEIDDNKYVAVTVWFYFPLDDIDNAYKVGMVNRESKNENPRVTKTDLTIELDNYIYECFGKKTKDKEGTFLGAYFNDEDGNITILVRIDGENTNQETKDDACDKLMSFYRKLMDYEFGEKYDGTLSITIGAAQSPADDDIILTSFIDISLLKDYDWNKSFDTYEEFIEAANINFKK